MTTPTQPTNGPADKPTVYRGPLALAGGVIVLLFCVAGAVDLLAEVGSADLPGAAAMLLVGSLAFAYGVVPAAFSSDESLVVRNPLRTIELPWGTVTRLSAQLSFIVHTAHRRFTVWAVPVSVRDRRKVDRARYRESARARREEQRAQRGGTAGGLGGFGFGGGARQRPGSEIERLSYADQAMNEMSARREGWYQRAGLASRLVEPEFADGASAGAAPAETPVSDENLKITWNRVSIAPILACLVFLVIAVIVH
jgi:hypothetical protein